MDKEEEKVKDLIEGGSELTGNTALAAVGFLIGGPVGAAVGVGGGFIVSKVFKKIGTEIYDRWMGPREKMRIGAVTAFAIEAIQNKIKQGKEIRTDSFFDTDSGHRSKAEEILEGVMLKAKDSYEEKKIKYIGNIYSSAAFSSISGDFANHTLKTIESLTYRQLCCLALYNDRNNRGAYNLRQKDFRISFIEIEAQVLLQELYELYTLGLIYLQENLGTPHATAMLGFHDIVPAFLHLTPLAGNLCGVAGLSEIPKEDIQKVVDLLNTNKTM